MGCCNQAPKGGSNNLGLLMKLIGGIFVLLLIVSLFFH